MRHTGRRHRSLFLTCSPSIIKRHRSGDSPLQCGSRDVPLIAPAADRIRVASRPTRETHSYLPESTLTCTHRQRQQSDMQQLAGVGPTSVCYGRWPACVCGVMCNRRAGKECFFAVRAARVFADCRCFRPVTGKRCSTVFQRALPLMMDKRRDLLQI